MSREALLTAAIIALGGSPVTSAQASTFRVGLSELRSRHYVDRGGLTGKGRAAFAVALGRLGRRG